MRNRKLMVLVAAVSLLVSASPVMAVIEFNDGGEWDIDYETRGHVTVDYQSPGMGTTVNMLEGGRILWLLDGYEDSIINFLGGVIVGSRGRSVGSGGISAHDSSQVAISGGALQNVFGYGSSQITVSGGRIYREFNLEDNAALTIVGSGFAVDGTPVGYIELTSILGGNYPDEPTRRLTGTLLNGDPLDNDFHIGHNAKIILVQTLITPAEQIENILETIESSVAEGTLEGIGSGKSAKNRLNALINMLESTSELIVGEYFDDAYAQLVDVLKKCDGQVSPPDFVDGEAREELADMIMELMEGLMENE